MYTTVEALRAELAKARVIALAKFEEDWGTRDVGVVGEALRQTIPGSVSPADAAQKALALLRRPT